MAATAAPKCAYCEDECWYRNDLASMSIARHLGAAASGDDIGE
jgi:hypothetical protein